MRMVARKIFLIVILFIGLFSPQVKAHLPENTSAKNEKINSAFESFLSHKELRNGTVAFTLIENNTGKVLIDYNANLGLATASTLKTITSATAYHILGADYTYKTRITYSGHIDNQGVLHGDLFIEGSGDPTLGSSRYAETQEDTLLNQWVNEIKQYGIRKINGRIIGDDLLFQGTQTPGGWPWRDMGNYYGAGNSSLNWRENSFGVTFKTAPQVGEKTQIEKVSVPLPPNLKLVNEVITGSKGSGDNVYAYAAPYSDFYFLRGEHGIDLKKNIQFSTPDPALDLAFQLKNRIQSNGIEVENEAYSAYIMQIESGESLPPVEGRKLIYVHESPSLDKIVYWFNRVSVNLYGESLLKTMALHLGQSANTVDAASLVRDFWSEKLGINRNELRILDGSGLSPEIRVSSNAIAKILESVKSEPWYEGFYDSLPTINNMKMKSGTISGVLGYAGYHTDKEGNSYTFSLLVGNYEGGASAMRSKMFNMLNSLK